MWFAQDIGILIIMGNCIVLFRTKQKQINTKSKKKNTSNECNK